MKTKFVLISRRTQANVICLLCAIGLAQSVFAQTAGKILQVLDPKSHHLGATEIKDWPETTIKPEGFKLELKFQAEANADEVVLGIRQRGVSGPWVLKVNGDKIADLQFRVANGNKEAEVFYYPLAPHALVTGENTLTIEASIGYDIAVGPITLNLPGEATARALQAITISVTDRSSGKFIPARVTITDTKNNPALIRKNNETGDIALRRGLLYTRGTPTSVSLPEGEYFVYATRGMEWSRAEKKLSVRPGKASEVKLKIEREVDTTGFIAADTHIHTLTFSGHGDASVEERMLTLAGEGVEMAVSTDHNHQTDYHPYQEKMRVSEYFTPVTGNEVTTPVGHMNAFPLDPKSDPPPYQLTNWVQLVDGIRGKGAKVVILNHPRWPSLPKCPFTVFGLNRVSGDFGSEVKFPFDAMELANALVPQPDPLYVIKDWFALLNAGHKITGAGASDTHTVGEPPGMSRSYVPSVTDDPTQIDVDAACNHFLRGETTVSLGIFADVLVDGRYKMGQTNSLHGDKVNVRLRAASPSWVSPKRAIVYLNGQQVAEKPIPAGAPRRPTNVLLDFAVKAPTHDAYLVCVVLGDGASHPSWMTKEKFTLAVTNPIFLDADGDGQYTSPRGLAWAALTRAGISTDHQWEAVADADDAVAVQMVSLMRERWPESDQADLETRVREAATKRACLREYLSYPLPPIKVSASQLK